MTDDAKPVILGPDGQRANGPAPMHGVENIPPGTEVPPWLPGIKPGTRIVSNTFTMGDWEPDVKVDLNSQPGCESSYCTVLHWVVPRKVAGTYQVAQGDLTLRQQFQMLTGTLKSGDTTAELKGRVRGEAIEISVGEKRYAGRLKGKVLELREAAQ